MDLNNWLSAFDFTYETLLSVLFLWGVCRCQSKRPLGLQLLGAVVLLSTIWMYLDLFRDGTTYGTDSLFDPIIRPLYRVVAYYGFLRLSRCMGSRRTFHIAALCACAFLTCHTLMRTAFFVGISHPVGGITGILMLDAFLYSSASHLVFLAVILLFMRGIPFSRITEIQILQLLIVCLVIVCNQYIKHSLGNVITENSSEYAMISLYAIILMGLTSAFLILSERNLVNRREQQGAELQRIVAGYRLESIEQHNREIQNTRELRHDMKNHLISIRHMIRRQDIVGLEGYVEDLIGRFSASAARAETGNLVLNGLISEKLMEAQRKQITLSVEINATPFSYVSDTDLCIIFGNALDNALDACQKIEDSEKRFVRIRCAAALGNTVVLIENSFEGKLRVFDEFPITSKDNAALHGMGLANIRRALHRYGGDMVWSASPQGEFRLSLFFPLESTA